MLIKVATGVVARAWWHFDKMSMHTNVTNRYKATEFFISCCSGRTGLLVIDNVRWTRVGMLQLTDVKHQRRNTWKFDRTVSWLVQLQQVRQHWWQMRRVWQWRHNEHGVVSYHQPHDCLLNRLFRRKSMKPSKLRVTGLCEGNSPVTDEFPAQRASNAENVSICWCNHDWMPLGHQQA